MTKFDIQRILDHWGLGKVLTFHTQESLYLVDTSRGKFAVAEHSGNLYDAWLEHDAMMRTIKRIFGGAEQHLLADTRGEMKEELSFVHQGGRYYSVYEIIRA